MKKIYLLSAAACLFAFSAKADWVLNLETGESELVEVKANLECNEWFTSGANATGAKYVEMQVSGSTKSALIKDVVKVAVTDTGDQWATQFCNVFDKGTPGFAPGALFQMEFDVYWKGPNSDTVQFNLLTGKLLDDGENKKPHDDWQWDSGKNKEFEYGDNFWGIHNASSGPVVKETWTHIVWPKEPTKLGDAGWLGLQINLANKGAKNTIGNFFFANMKLTFGAQVYELWNTEATTAVSEVAAIKAYVANDVLFASEAADVVVYNINGVAVKSAKNVTSLNVADLKAGLYIAKVGNATVKFVK